MERIKKLGLATFLFTIITTIIITLLATLTLKSTPNNEYMNMQMSINDAFNFTATGISKYSMIIFLFIILIIYFTFSFLPIYIFIIIAKINNKIAYRKIENKNLIYERDLPEYNCAIAGFIIDGDVNPKKDIKALTEELKEEKIIIKEKDKYIINQSKYTELQQKKANRTAIYLVDCLTNKTQIKETTFTNNIIYDATELGLTTPNPLIYICFIFAFFTANVFALIFYFFYIAKNRQNNDFIELTYKLTSKGRLEKDRMIKLKKFIHQFSTIEGIHKTENHIWGRYVPFAMVLKEYND